MQRKAPTAEEMAVHVATICRDLDIRVESHSTGGRAARQSRVIWIRPVKSAITYAVALHEIGHVVGPRQSGRRLEKEAGAWEWAREAALAWTPAMQAKMEACIASYIVWSKRRKDVREAAAGHPILALIKPR